MVGKIIVSNRKILKKKYGIKGFSAISKALKVLIASDKKRGIEGKVMYLDSSTDMKKVKGKPVKNASDPRENKEAIDAIFKFLNAHYLMILGCPDVVPHQDLNNPIYSPSGDDDTTAWSDLPYACDKPYSQDSADFVGPTRVVGRLPDLFSAKEPSFLLSLLENATNYTVIPVDEYKVYLGLSTDVWQGSTRQSVTNIFGSSDRLLLAPPSGPEYPNKQLNSLMHFINCHGAPESPEFYGQQGNDYPISLTTQSTIEQICKGTISSVECCYGAELYNSITLDIDMPICQSYLKQGGYGYFGSTTIAYGPADDNGAADLICQYFLLNVLKGASIGSAVLMARQQYVDNVAQMDAIDLKTLAQFYLLGDPSITPVEEPSVTKLPIETSTNYAKHFFRSERREKMKLKGEFLVDNKITASKQVPLGKVNPTSRKALADIAKLAGFSEKQKFLAFAIKETYPLEKRGAKMAVAPSRYFITIGTPEGMKKLKKIKQGVAVVAKELNGQIVGYRIYHQR